MKNENSFEKVLTNGNTCAIITKRFTERRKTKSGRVVQSVSTPACHAGGRGFEPLHGRQIMPQMKICGIKNAAIAQMVEHVIGNDEVSSSNLLSSSKKKRQFTQVSWRFFSLFSLHFSLDEREMSFPEKR